MVTVPPFNPVTTPVPVPIDAIAGLLLLHAPPGVELLNVVLLPWQTAGAPAIGEGIPTDIAVVDRQPAVVV